MNIAERKAILMSILALVMFLVTCGFALCNKWGEATFSLLLSYRLEEYAKEDCRKAAQPQAKGKEKLP